MDDLQVCYHHLQPRDILWCCRIFPRVALLPVHPQPQSTVASVHHSTCVDLKRGGCLADCLAGKLVPARLASVS
jgi:hypothetical protein